MTHLLNPSNLVILFPTCFVSLWFSLLECEVAREIHEREDLLRDATALSPRIQLRLLREDTPLEVFAGFRKEGAVSIYFGDDPVYHFNTRQELRRAFVDDRLFKAEQGRLVAWTPDRNDQRTDMHRHDLTFEEEQHFLQTMHATLTWLRKELDKQSCDIVGQVPVDGDAFPRLQEWIESHREVVIADTPRVRA